LRHGLCQRHFTGKTTGIVARRPVTDGDGFVHHTGFGRISGFQSGQIDKGLPCRTSLTAGLGGAVELAVRIGGAADHGAHTAIAVQCHQCGLFHALVLVAVQNAAYGALGIRLDGQIKRGLDDQVLGLFADHAAHLLVQPVDEILGMLAG